MKNFFALLAAAVLLTSSALAAGGESSACLRHVLTPDERTALADIVFEGKVTDASCKCLALARTPNTYGPKAECSDMIAVINTRKGAVAPQFVLQNFVMLDSDDSATFSQSECEDAIKERNKKLIGENDIYYIKREGAVYQSIPLAACD